MPIANAKVEIWKDGVLIATGYTDEYGKYTYPLDVGTYDIIISKEGYQTITKHETVSTRTQLVVNLPSLSVAVSTDGLATITLAKDYGVGSTDKAVSVSVTKDTSLDSTDKSPTITLTYETAVA